MVGMAKPTPNMRKVVIEGKPGNYLLWGNNVGAKQSRLLPEADWTGNLRDVIDNLDTLTFLADSTKLRDALTGQPLTLPAPRTPAKVLPKGGNKVDVEILNKDKWIDAQAQKSAAHGFEADRLKGVDVFNIHRQPGNFQTYAAKVMRVFPAGEEYNEAKNSFLVPITDIMSLAHGATVSDLAKLGYAKPGTADELDSLISQPGKVAPTPAATPAPQVPAPQTPAAPKSKLQTLDEMKAQGEREREELKKNLLKYFGDANIDQEDLDDLMGFDRKNMTSSKRKASQDAMSIDDLNAFLGIE
jgi:hypothetical protein